MDSEADLCELIARVAVGQYTQALSIIQASGLALFPPTHNAIDSAIRKLSVPDGKDAWQRDGWVFQIISWIAAHLQQPDDLKSPPHMIHAGKGFDGLHVSVDHHGKITKVVVCEEKASTSVRNKITQQVWPEFRALEDGRREDELIAETTTLLRLHAVLDAEQAVSEILWGEVKHYRVSVTIGDKENSTKGLASLFKGYDECVRGSDPKRRRAETLYLSDTRDWLAKISDTTIELLEKMKLGDV